MSNKKQSQERDGTVGEVIDQRVQVYGDPTETFVRIAQVWSGILGHEVNATDVPLCLAGMKAVRATQAPDYSDNSDDIEGYLDIFRQLVGPDMIHARSVPEYIAQKEARQRHQQWVDDTLRDAHGSTVSTIVGADEPLPGLSTIVRLPERQS